MVPVVTIGSAADGGVDATAGTNAGASAEVGFSPNGGAARGGTAEPMFQVESLQRCNNFDPKEMHENGTLQYVGRLGCVELRLGN